jgi:hypothetical protein
MEHIRVVRESTIKEIKRITIKSLLNFFFTAILFPIVLIFVLIDFLLSINYKANPIFFVYPFATLVLTYFWYKSIVYFANRIIYKGLVGDISDRFKVLLENKYVNLSSIDEIGKILKTNPYPEFKPIISPETKAKIYTEIKERIKDDIKYILDVDNVIGCVCLCKNYTGILSKTQRIHRIGKILYDTKSILPNQANYDYQVLANFWEVMLGIKKCNYRPKMFGDILSHNNDKDFSNSKKDLEIIANGFRGIGFVRGL